MFKGAVIYDGCPPGDGNLLQRLTVVKGILAYTLHNVWDCNVGKLRTNINYRILEADKVLRQSHILQRQAFIECLRPYAGQGIWHSDAGEGVTSLKCSRSDAG